MKKSILTSGLGIALFLALPGASLQAQTSITVSVSTPYIGVGLSTGSYLPYLYGGSLGLLYSPLFYTPYLPIYSPIENPDPSDIAYLQNMGETKRIAWEEQRRRPAAPIVQNEPFLNSQNIQINKSKE